MSYETQCGSCTATSLRDFPLTGLDVIFCRNVLIYFERSFIDQLLGTFHAALNPGGVLFLGHTDTASSRPDLFRPRITHETIVYERCPARRDELTPR